MDAAELKHRIRQLKSLELRIRYGIQDVPTQDKGKDRKPQRRLPLLWDDYFDLNGSGRKKARYSIDQLLDMDKEQYKKLVDEFIFQVYYRSYQESGVPGFNLYDPELLRQLELPFDADSNAVTKRFRELAKLYHPDAGGDSEAFIKLMELKNLLQK